MPPLPPARNTTGAFLKNWLPVLLWMSLTFLASTDLMSASHTSRFLEPFLLWWMPSLSPIALDFAHLVVRKAAHITEYAILALLLCRAFWRTWRMETPVVSAGRAVFLVLFVAALYAGSDEYHQSFVASRGASGFDVLFDIGGAILGTSIYLAMQHFRVRRLRRSTRAAISY